MRTHRAFGPAAARLLAATLLVMVFLTGCSGQFSISKAPLVLNGSGKLLLRSGEYRILSMERGEWIVAQTGFRLTPESDHYQGHIVPGARTYVKGGTFSQHNAFAGFLCELVSLRDTMSRRRPYVSKEEDERNAAFAKASGVIFNELEKGFGILQTPLSDYKDKDPDWFISLAKYTEFSAELSIGCKSCERAAVDLFGTKSECASDGSNCKQVPVVAGFKDSADVNRGILMQAARKFGHEFRPELRIEFVRP